MGKMARDKGAKPAKPEWLEHFEREVLTRKHAERKQWLEGSWDIQQTKEQCDDGKSK